MIIVAIDQTNFVKASEILNNLDSKKCMIKIGSVAFNSIGHEIVYRAAEEGFDIFLDLKLHDIPNTVKKSIEGLASLPIQMLSIHTSGGKDMMTAMEAASDSQIKIFGVTALTSLNDCDTDTIFQRSASEHVDAMLDLAQLSGIDGVVCSPHELELVSSRESLLSITPGIRVQDSNDDQKRFMTPKEAIDRGADYLVIGRPITESDNISNSLNDIYESIQ